MGRILNAQNLSRYWVLPTSSVFYTPSPTMHAPICARHLVCSLGRRHAAQPRARGLQATRPEICQGLPQICQDSWPGCSCVACVDCVPLCGLCGLGAPVWPVWIGYHCLLRDPWILGQEHWGSREKRNIYLLDILQTIVIYLGWKRKEKIIPFGIVELHSFMVWLGWGSSKPCHHFARFF